MATSRFKNSLANRGVDAEKAVQNYLELWQSKSPRREYERLIDTKAAGRVIKAASADFAFYSNDTKLSKFGLIEVKETKHTYRLSRDRITQMARLRKRANAGGICLILVLHSETALWRWMEAPVAHNWGGVASWDMSGLPTFTSPGLALADATRGVFD